MKLFSFWLNSYTSIFLWRPIITYQNINKQFFSMILSICTLQSKSFTFFFLIYSFYSSTQLMKSGFIDWYLSSIATALMRFNSSNYSWDRFFLSYILTCFHYSTYKSCNAEVATGLETNIPGKIIGIYCFWSY